MENLTEIDVLSPSYQDEIYDIYKFLRDQRPVFWDEKSNAWLLSRFEDVQAAMKDKARLKNGGTRQDVLPQLQATDDKLHSDLKLAVAPRLLAGAVAHVEPEVRRIVRKIFDDIERTGHCDLMRDVVHKIPKQVVPPLLGIADHFMDELVELVDPLAGFDPVNPVYVSENYVEEFGNLVDRILDAKAGGSSDDLIGQLLALELKGEIERSGIQTIVRSLLFAAFDTTINLLANGTVLLAENPVQRKKLAANMDLLPSAILEMLRMESPAQVEPRRVVEPVVFQGQQLSVGQEVVLLIGSANRDERHFDSPDKFDIERNPDDHLAMGFGVHKCVGRHLALLEARVYFEELLKRFTDFKIGERRHLVSNWARAFAFVDFRCAS